MNMQTVILLLLMPSADSNNPPPLLGFNWVDNNHNFVVTNTGDFIIFKPAAA